MYVFLIASVYENVRVPALIRVAVLCHDGLISQPALMSAVTALTRLCAIRLSNSTLYAINMLNYIYLCNQRSVAGIGLSLLFASTNLCVNSFTLNTMQRNTTTSLLWS